MNRKNCYFSEEQTARRFYLDMKQTGRNPSTPHRLTASGKWFVTIDAMRAKIAI